MANTRGQQRAAARLRQPKRRLSITSREIELCESLIWFVLATKPQCEIRAEKVIAEMIPGVYCRSKLKILRILSDNSATQ